MLNELIADVYQNVELCKKEIQQICNPNLIRKRLDNCREHAKMYIYYKQQTEKTTITNKKQKNKENINAGVQTSIKNSIQVNFDLESIQQDDEVQSRKSLQQKQQKLSEDMRSIQLSQKDDPSSIKFDSSSKTAKTEDHANSDILYKLQNGFDQINDTTNIDQESNSEYQMSDFLESDDEDDVQHITSYYTEGGKQIDKNYFKKLLEENRNGAQHIVYSKVNNKKIPNWAMDNKTLKQQSYQQFLNNDYLKNFGKLQHQKQVHWLKIFDETVIMERFESDRWTPANSDNENLDTHNRDRSLNETNISENIRMYQLTRDYYQMQNKQCFQSIQKKLQIQQNLYSVIFYEFIQKPIVKFLKNICLQIYLKIFVFIKLFYSVLLL